jgi:hypothetical protein
VACFANFLRAAAKLDARVAFMAELLPTDVMLLLGDTWLSGGTVAVVLVTLLLAGLTMVKGGGFDPCGSPEKHNGK